MHVLKGFDKLCDKLLNDPAVSQTIKDRLNQAKTHTENAKDALDAYCEAKRAEE